VIYGSEIKYPGNTNFACPSPICQLVCVLTPARTGQAQLRYSDIAHRTSKSSVIAQPESEGEGGGCRRKGGSEGSV